MIHFENDLFSQDAQSIRDNFQQAQKMYDVMGILLLDAPSNTLKRYEFFWYEEEQLIHKSRINPAKRETRASKSK